MGAPHDSFPRVDAPPETGDSDKPLPGTPALDSAALDERPSGSAEFEGTPAVGGVRMAKIEPHDGQRAYLPVAASGTART